VVVREQARHSSQQFRESSTMTAKQKAAKRKYNREYARRYYDKNYASWGLHKGSGRPAKLFKKVRHAKENG
jgi:hypothetical protein